MTDGMTLDQAYELLNMEQNLDVEILEQHVLSAFLSQDNGQRSLSESVLVRVRDHERAWERVDVMYVQSNHAETKFFALQILQSMIRTRWRTLDAAQRAAIRDFLVGTIASLTGSPESYAKQRMIVAKLNVTLVEILKIEWPTEWPTFIPDLVETSKTNETVCQNSMCILQLLSEEVFDYAADQYSKRQARTLQDAMRDEFGLVFDMCMYVLSQSTHNALLLATLQTLSRFLQWVDEEYIYDTALIQKLLTMCLHTNSDASHRLPALECLCEIASLRLRHPLNYHTQHLGGDESAYTQAVYEVPADAVRIALYLQLVPQLAQYLPHVDGPVGVGVEERIRRRELYAAWYYQSQETQDFSRAMALFVTGYLSNNLCLYEQPSPSAPPNNITHAETSISTAHRSQAEKHAQLLGGLNMLTKLCWLPDDTDSTTLTVVLEFFARLLSDALPNDRSECGPEQPRLQIHRELYAGAVGELLSVLAECIPVDKAGQTGTARPELKIDEAVDWITHSSAACIRVLQRIAHMDADRDGGRRTSGCGSGGKSTRGSLTSTQTHTLGVDGEIGGDDAEVKDRNFYIARDLVGMIAHAYPDMAQAMLLGQLGEVVKATPTDASMTSLRRVCQCIESIGTEGQPPVPHQHQLINSTLGILHPYTIGPTTPTPTQQYETQVRVGGSGGRDGDRLRDTAQRARVLAYRCVFVGVVLAHASTIQKTADTVAMVMRMLFEWIYEASRMFAPGQASSRGGANGWAGSECYALERECAEVLCVGFEKLCGYEGVQKALTEQDGVRSLVDGADSVTAHLGITNQRHIYNGVAILIACVYVEIDNTPAFVQALLQGSNNTWQRLMNEQRATEPALLCELLSVLAVNQAVCEPLGQAYDPQFLRLFPDCLAVYRTLGTSGFNTSLRTGSGLAEPSVYIVAVQRAILLLARTYMAAVRRDDYTPMRDHTITPLLQTVVPLYCDGALDEHVLLLLVHVSTILKTETDGMLGYICDYAIKPTIAKLRVDSTALPEHQEPLFKLMNTHIAYCFSAVLVLDDAYQSLYFENFLLGMRSHNFRVSELSCQAIRISLTNATDLAKGLLGNPPDSRVRSAMGFLQKYYLAVLPVALDVLLDTALESRFFDTCALLSMMVRLLTQDQVPALYPDCEPMSGTTDAPNDTVEANTTAAKNVIASHLLNTRGRLQRSQVLQFCDRVFLDFGNVRALGFVLKDLMKAIKSSEVEPEHGEETLHI